MKEYVFEDGKYDFCEDRRCDLMDQLQDGDKPHMLCCNCIEKYEGVKPEFSELCSTSKLRMNRTIQW